MNLEFNKPYTYSDICKIFKLERKRGRSQKLQIEKLKKDYIINKNNRFYIFTGKYTEEEKLLYGINITYKQYIQYIIADLITQSETGTITLNMMELLKKCNFINEDFSSCRYNAYFSALILETNVTDLNIFIENSYKLLSRLIKETLWELTENETIICHIGYRLFKNRYNFTEYKDFSPETEVGKKIMEMQFNLSRQMGYSDVKDLYSNYKDINLFKEQMKNKIIENFPEYNNYCKTYIICSTKSIASTLKKELYKKINDKIKNKLLNSKSLIELEDLTKYVEATIDSKKIYKIKETISKYKEPEKYLEYIDNSIK